MNNCKLTTQSPEFEIDTIKDPNNNQKSPFDYNQAIQDIGKIFDSVGRMKEIKEQHTTIRRKIESDEKKHLAYISEVRKTMEDNLKGSFARDALVLNQFFYQLDRAIEKGDLQSTEMLLNSIVNTCASDHLSSSIRTLAETRKLLSSDDPIEL